jgi:replicative DNA helicase
MTHRNIELEEAVIGAALFSSESYDVASSVIPSSEAFTDPDYRATWEAMGRMAAASQRIDLLTVVDYLTKRGRPDVPKLMQANSRVSSDANIEHHARIITQHYVGRNLLKACDQIKHRMQEEPDAFEALEYAEKLIFNLPGDIRTGQVGDAAKAVRELVDKAERIRSTPDGCVGLSTGLSLLDSRWSGLVEPRLYILAARPGMGKTALMLAFVKEQAQAGIPTLIFSLEMNASELIGRLIAGVAGVTGQDITDPRKMSADQYRRFIAAAEEVSGWPIYIEDTPGISITSMRSISRKFAKDKGIRAVYVDYIQLATGEQVKGANREQEVSSITRGLKNMAKELKCPVVALSQLSRACEARADKRPNLADLRESGGIEQDADVVAFILRLEYYGIEQDDAGTPTRGLAELITAKNRHGSTGTDVVRFHGPSTTFSDLDDSATFGALPEPMDAFNPNVSHRPKLDTDLPF